MALTIFQAGHEMSCLFFRLYYSSIKTARNS